MEKFGDKFSDEELEKMDLKSLEDTANAVIRFAPSDEEPTKIPVAPKDDKKELEDKLGAERIDPTKIFEDVNKEFNLEGY